MGYSTDFVGSFSITPPLNEKDKKDLEKLHYSIGGEGGKPPSYCQWRAVSADSLEWDKNEKFYHYVEWLEYLIDSFFYPRWYRISGKVSWQGESARDSGMIWVRGNRVSVFPKEKLESLAILSVSLMEDLRDSSLWEGMTIKQKEVLLEMTMEVMKAERVTSRKSGK